MGWTDAVCRDAAAGRFASLQRLVLGGETLRRPDNKMVRAPWRMVLVITTLLGIVMNAATSVLRQTSEMPCCEAPSLVSVSADTADRP